MLRLLWANVVGVEPKGCIELDVEKSALNTLF